MNYIPVFTPSTNGIQFANDFLVWWDDTTHCGQNIINLMDYFRDSLNEAVRADTRMTLQEFDTAYVPGLTDIIKNIVNNVMFEIAMSFLVIFMLIEFIRISEKVQQDGTMGVETLVKSIIKFVIVESVITNIYSIMGNGIFFGRQMVIQIGNAMIGWSHSESYLGSITADEIDALISNWDSAKCNFLINVVQIGITVSAFLIHIIVMWRMVQLALYTLVSPIPAATLINEEYRHIGQNFFKGFMAIIFQGVLIKMIVSIFRIIAPSVLMTTLTQTGDVVMMIVKCLAFSIVMVVMVFGSQRFAKGIVGVM